MNSRAFTAALSCLFFCCVTLAAQVPQQINYQGRILVGSTNFNGTGLFKFALVNASGATLWSNDGTASGEPAKAVSLTVSKGLYSVMLGDVAITYMTAIPITVFAGSEVRLRIWFNDGVSGSQMLTPDQRLGSVPYALIAATVQDGAITSAKLGAGTISGVIGCNATSPAEAVVYIAGKSIQAYVGPLTGSAYPYQLSNVPAGTQTVTARLASGATASQQVTVTAGQTTTLDFPYNTDAENCGTCGHSCNDGLLCTIDTCTAGACSNLLQAGNCLISGVCYANGDAKPGNPCQVCNASSNPNGWTNSTAGVICAPNTCSGSSSVTSTCDGTGVCRQTSQSCSPNQCDNATGTCRTTCASNADCSTGFVCTAGVCKSAQGSACTSDAQCGTGFCTDGVCCNSRCAGLCQACNITGSTGTCTNIPNGQDPGNECIGNATCNGAGGCTACTPKTCTQLGVNCGTVSDGCGNTLNCGSCTAPQTCGGGGTPNVCGSPPCTPKTCTQLGANCGTLGDGCGNTINCGSCPAPKTCGGGGVPNVCGP